MSNLTRVAAALVASAVCLAPLAPAQTITFVEEFEGGSNAGSWDWGTGGESFSPLNGNPGAFLQDLTLFSCCPTLSTSGPSAFSGDYRALGVSSVGADLVTLDADVSVGSRPLTVMLTSGAGGAFFVGEKTLPEAGVPIEPSPAGWTSFDFEIDPHAESLPDGWSFFGGATSWSDVVTDVDSLAFYYGVPGDIYIVHAWDVGLDNARITVADCNGNGTPDFQDLSGGTSLDLDGDAVPDECQPLSADTDTLSLAAGGAQNLALHAGASHAGDLYLLLGSAAGTSPGVPVGGGTLPLNVDGYFLFTLGNANTPPLSGSFGVLGPAGDAAAQFALPAGSPATLAGATVWHAYVTLDAVTVAPELASNAMPLTLAP